MRENDLPRCIQCGLYQQECRCNQPFTPAPAPTCACGLPKDHPLHDQTIPPEEAHAYAPAPKGATVLTREAYATTLRDIFQDGAITGHGAGNHERAVAHDAALRARLDAAEAEVVRLKRSMTDHFDRDHLAGDGPEIDRWKARVAALTDALREIAGRVHATNYPLECERIARAALEGK